MPLDLRIGETIVIIIVVVASAAALCADGQAS